jgi:hypothetical protein
MNVVLDTGATRTTFPHSVATLLGVEPDITSEDMIGLGEPVPCSAAVLDLRIVDAAFPKVACFEFSSCLVTFPTDPNVLAYPVLGWDVLGLFNIELEPTHGRIGLRLARPARSSQ